jgi:hypothetical protein
MTKHRVGRPEKFHREELRQYIKLHLDKILKEITQTFGARDISILYRIRSKVFHDPLASRAVTRMGQN